MSYLSFLFGGGGGGLVAKLGLNSCDRMTVALQAALSMAFPRLEYWSGLSFPSPGDLPDPGTEPTSPAWQVDSLPLNHLASPLKAYQEANE